MPEGLRGSRLSVVIRMARNAERGVGPEAAPFPVWLAWRRYLRAIRASDERSYERVEELAWQRLVGELERLGRPLERPHGRQDGRAL